MEASSEPQANNVRRSGRAKKPIERFAPLLADDPSLLTSVLSVEPVAMAAGARRQRKRQHSAETSPNVAKRRKASRPTPQVTSGMFSCQSLYSYYFHP